ncbi:5646_t:CDS:2 [Rhizophagus irregularis]|nr:5646_t:CDS:2 [Rhizophagus irregularis]
METNEPAPTGALLSADNTSTTPPVNSSLDTLIHAPFGSISTAIPSDTASNQASSSNASTILRML